MNIQEAKHILLLYRPGMGDGQDPDLEQALQLARQDVELGRWFEQHQAMQAKLRSRFREITIPERLSAELKARLNEAVASNDSQEAVQRLQERRRPKAEANPWAAFFRPAIWSQSPAWLALAAGIVLLVGLAGFWLRPVRPDRFTHYRAMMVSTALRGYNMECETNDMGQVRQYFITKGTPADYTLPPGLQKLQLLGAAALTWRTNPVSMICFERPDKQKVWLFVMARDAVKDPPSPAPAEFQVSALETASWIAGDKTYLVAGPPETGFKNQYF